MTIEFLYPELCNLYGDRGNMDYLRRCLPADTRQTYMGDEPWFVQGAFFFDRFRFFHNNFIIHHQHHNHDLR